MTDRRPVCPQEVTLQRSSTSERLGLTLYYPDGDDAPDETDVLVRGVEAGGIAARDGRIQPGDQIIQVRQPAAVRSGLPGDSRIRADHQVWSGQVRNRQS